MNELSITARNIRYWAPLEEGWERMKALLFRPFDLGLWLVLGFSAWLAGLGSGPGSGGANLSDSPKHIGRSLRHAVEPLFHSMFVLSLVIFVGLAVFLLIILLLWLSSRGKFIYLENVLRQRAEIVEPWGRMRRLGDSLFLWRLAFLLAIVVLLAFVVMVPAAFAIASGGTSVDGLSFFALSSFGLIFVLAAVVFGVGIAVVGLFLDAFVVPIMYRFDLKATEAWKFFLPWLKARPGAFILYTLFCLLLFMGYGLIALLACAVTCCLAALPYVGTVVMLPLLVTYRYFSLGWLAQFDPGFDFFSPLEPGDDFDEAEDEVVESEAE